METLEAFGLVGLFFVCFVASSLYPLGSEAFVLGFVAFGYSEVVVWCVATLGNTLGSLTTYGIGYLGETRILQRYFKNANAKIHRYKNGIQKYGFLFAFLSFLPIVGDGFALALGVYRYSLFKMALWVAFGKGLRYLALLGAFSWWQTL